MSTEKLHFYYKALTDTQNIPLADGRACRILSMFYGSVQGA